MSGSDFDITCPECGAVNRLRGKAMTIALTCQSCQVYFPVGHSHGNKTRFNHKEPAQAIPIGARGKFDNVTYEVMGFVIKRENVYKYEWREYLLFNPYQGYAFLSEYNGHWNFIWPIEDEPVKVDEDKSPVYENRIYNLYQKYYAKVVYAKGEFFFDVVDITNTTFNYEFIDPPYLIALEQSEDSILWCKGEYVSANEVASAFSMPVIQLPGKEGIGYTQPLVGRFTLKSLVVFTALAVSLTIVMQLVMNSMAEDETVFSAGYNKQDLNDQKMFVTPSFEVEQGVKSLGVYVYAPIDNDWFFSEFTLINEDNGKEYNFAREIEYYHGYDDGAWVEGSKTGEAYLSQIPGGHYHLNIYPEFGDKNYSFTVTVKRDVPMSSNFYVVCIGFLLFPVFYFIRHYHRERLRWEDSDYSPYSSE